MKICDWLLVLFIALKLTHYIDWSWWLVTLPYTVPLAMQVVGVVLIKIGEGQRGVR